MLRMTRTHRVLVLALAVLMFGFTVGLVASGATTPAPAAVHLHLGSDGHYFSFGSTTQNLTTASNSCAINSAEPVMHLTSTPTHSAPGLVGNYLGVKNSSSGSNGTPCGQIDNGESLTLTPGTSIASRTFSSLRMDLQMTGNATAKLTLSNGSTSKVFKLQTGTNVTVPPVDKTAPYLVNSGPNDTLVSCAAKNSSGPNSGYNDNCEWTVTPGFNFNKVTLTALDCGTVSLGGSGDFGNDPNYDTVFYVTNNPPTPQNDSYSVNENATLNGNVLANDTDPDGNALTASVVTQPTHGALSLSSTGAFTYTPAQNYFGPDSFVYAASDGLLSTNATANINVVHVNQLPVAVDDSASMNENTSAQINVAANDTDVDGPTPLVATNIQAITPAASTAVANNDGTVTFTPPADYTGAASFTYQAEDGAGGVSANTATVNITVIPVICTNQTVSTNDGSVQGSFTRLGDADPCKPYQLTASQSDGTVLFEPSGASMVNYRGFVDFGPDVSVPGALSSTIEYDPTGGTNFRPMQWCVNPQFDGQGNVTNATIPDGETWCIASAATIGGASGSTSTNWQIFGFDDPRLRH
jgi:VCBS repeat-containing protein